MSEFIKNTPEDEGKKIDVAQKAEDIVGPILLHVRKALKTALKDKITIVKEHGATVDKVAENLLYLLDLNPPKVIQPLLAKAKPPVVSEKYGAIEWSFPNDGLNENGELLDVIEKALAHIDNRKTTDDEEDQATAFVNEYPVCHPGRTWVLVIKERGEKKGAKVVYYPYGEEA